MKTLRKGQRVRLKPGSPYLWQNSGIGTAQDNGVEHTWVRVKWDKRHNPGEQLANSYRPPHLIEAEEKWKENFANLRGT